MNRLSRGTEKWIHLPQYYKLNVGRPMVTNQSEFGQGALFARRAFMAPEHTAYQINSIYRNDTWIR